ncbi:Fatty acid hydroxylase [Pyrenophora seminiperda CCB06]|uniref:Fatty acid hydroxylase n=1 Tax=Pyrenophora seminiperda CCB06 TaxID=1302712 RepID=A0A3M7MDB4_9PLEO|nr:Fatty acid hydroxylase [Pyrenophora seminiperda CCB06]
MEHTFDDAKAPYWKPQHVQVDSRMREFGHRLLRNFHYVWRHILRDTYNGIMLRVLARATVLLATLDFEVKRYTMRADDRPTQLPGWEPFEEEIVRVGAVWVVVCQDLEKGLEVAREHVASSSQEFRQTETSSTTMASGEERAHYMILSVKHIMLCHVTTTTTDQASPFFQHTAPEPLFNGDSTTCPPSDLALDYLLWATASARPSRISTPIHFLPVELQDEILDHTSFPVAPIRKPLLVQVFFVDG